MQRGRLVDTKEKLGRNNSKQNVGADHQISRNLPDRYHEGEESWKEHFEIRIAGERNSTKNS